VASNKIVDGGRTGAGRPVGEIIAPTLDIPPDCKCSWSVCTAGIGRACKSRLTYSSSLCRYRHTAEHPLGSNDADLTIPAAL
jgi:hypothetical protein